LNGLPDKATIFPSIVMCNNNGVDDRVISIWNDTKHSLAKTLRLLLFSCIPFVFFAQNL
jgi:hypothetical protein